ncbi:unnamed protein product [Trichobilharzia regenti]|nr:unnamed protein product [Trichobilharzia regenti]
MNSDGVVAPAPPRILSSNSTEFADYYLLNWETKSRAPLKNVTISIHELPKNTESRGGGAYHNATSNLSFDAGGSIVARSPKHHELVFNLEEDKVDRTSTSIDGNTTNNHLKSNIKKIWHHLTNLSADTQHDIALSVCNVHACTKSSSLSSSSSSSSVGSHLDGGDSSISGTSGKFVFKTPQFDDPMLQLCGHQGGFWIVLRWFNVSITVLRRRLIDIQWSMTATVGGPNVPISVDYMNPFKIAATHIPCCGKCQEARIPRS